ncbi:MAG: 3,4-dihydroxyphthalate decarboxylase [Acidimicrobiaceae bacterium]|nr:3,4-dihydroxyphthalate decarboxylase [Acidimicrobiaceae bacterium]
MSADPLFDRRVTVATACRILGRRGLVDGVLGHVSARVDATSLLVRCRGPEERGVALTEPTDIRLVDFDGNHLEASEGWHVPKELPIHTAVLRADAAAGAVVHAHPRSALLCGLARLPLAAVFGAYNIPALHLAAGGVPVYERSVLISRRELADEMVAAMGDRRVVLLRGHGITVAGDTVEQATVRAVDLEELCRVTVELAALGAHVDVVPERDRAELPDLGSAFNDQLHWQALVAEVLRGERGERRDVG